MSCRAKASTENHPGGLPQGKDGWAFFWSLYVHVTESSVVVAYHIQGCAGVQSQLWGMCNSDWRWKEMETTPPSHRNDLSKLSV